MSNLPDLFCIASGAGFSAVADISIPQMSTGIQVQTASDFQQQVGLWYGKLKF